MSDQLILPYRGGFESDDDLHTVNYRTIEDWARRGSRSELARCRYPTMDRWYGVGQAAWVGSNSVLVNKTGYTANILYAWPFPSHEGGLLYKLGSWATVAWAAGEDMRLGIYEATDIRNIYPGHLVYETEISVGATTGEKSVTANLGLEAQRVYWAAICFDATTTGQIAAVDLSTLKGPLGWSDPSATANPGHGISTAHTYGALPLTFPAGATIASVSPLSFPPVFMKFKEGT